MLFENGDVFLSSWSPSGGHSSFTTVTEFTVCKGTELTGFCICALGGVREMHCTYSTVNMS